MAFTFLESLPEGDHRQVIGETLRHLQTDVTGNPHRSEISFDKFWNPSWPSGALGLLEFRAIESLPKAAWMSAVALLWTSLAAWLLDRPARSKLRRFSTNLHDRFFLPSFLWQDLAETLEDLRAAGFPISQSVYREIWDWKFPKILHFQKGGAQLEIRRAHESWPLLCEMPVDGGTTSRFVDTSMQRIEVAANATFAESSEIRFNGRLLRLHQMPDGRFLAGLRYRRTHLSPSLHPGFPAQTPLQLDIAGQGETRHFLLGTTHYKFRSANIADAPPATQCKSGRPSEMTCDLRILA
jgi:uncharacterized protein (DUF2126 family)